VAEIRDRSQENYIVVEIRPGTYKLNKYIGKTILMAFLIMLCKSTSHRTLTCKTPMPKNKTMYAYFYRANSAD
jgi:hypothetical protein